MKARWLLSLALVAQAAWGDVLMLTVERTDREVRVLESHVASGELKAPHRDSIAGDLAWRVTARDGSPVDVGFLDLSPSTHLEWPGADGAIEQATVARETAVGLLRIPWSPAAARIEFFGVDPALRRRGRQTLLSGDTRLGAPLGSAEIVLSAPREILADAPVAVKIINSGPDANRLVWVFAGEGYLESEQSKFESDVVGIVAQMLERQPWAAYRGHVNVYLIRNSVSAQHMGINAAANSLFGLYYYYGVSARLIWSPQAESRITSFLALHAPGTYDLGFVLCNDTTGTGGSGGVYSIFNLYQSSFEIGLHEAGHSFGLLADEYVDSFYCLGDVYRGVNSQTITSLAGIQPSGVVWGPWIEAGTPLPGAGANGIGLFEGSHYCADDNCRPSFNCEMRQLGLPFCLPCREAMAVRLYDFLSILDTVDPLLGTVTGNASREFRVTALHATPDTTAITWLLDGVEVGTGVSLVHSFAEHQGTHTLQAVTEDATPWIRQDPYLSPLVNVDYPHSAAGSRRRVTRTWSVVGTPPPPPTGVMVR